MNFFFIVSTYLLSVKKYAPRNIYNCVIWAGVLLVSRETKSEV